MTDICSLPKGWFTAKEAKIPAATLRALANRNIVAVNTLFSPQKYCVISNEELKPQPGLFVFLLIKLLYI